MWPYSHTESNNRQFTLDLENKLKLGTQCEPTSVFHNKDSISQYVHLIMLKRFNIYELDHTFIHFVALPKTARPHPLLIGCDFWWHGVMHGVIYWSAANYRLSVRLMSGVLKSVMTSCSVFQPLKSAIGIRLIFFLFISPQIIDLIVNNLSFIWIFLTSSCLIEKSQLTSDVCRISPII